MGKSHETNVKTTNEEELNRQLEVEDSEPCGDDGKSGIEIVSVKKITPRITYNWTIMGARTL
jgi:hypothetical protein